MKNTGKGGSDMKQEITIGDRLISSASPVFVIAEMSGNHLKDYDRALAIMKAAKEAGADAIKLQTYTPDTITIDSDKKWFRIEQNTIWDGTTFHRLFQEACTPLEWQPELKRAAESEGLICFSSPFDPTAVDFMEEMGMPAYKIASLEITDIPLIRKVASMGKPMLISTGVANEEDIRLALQTCRDAGNDQVILLKCASAYPTPAEDMNLSLIPAMKTDFKALIGLSDHTLGSTMAVAAVALGARVIEKHLTLSRTDGGPDAAFSMEPDEFREMTRQIRNTEKALGSGAYMLTEMQNNSRRHARSLFAVADIAKGEMLTPQNIRSIRPGYGLHTKYYEDILGRTAKTDIERGTPLEWGYFE